MKMWTDVGTDDFVRTEISRMRRWPDFLTHDTPLRAQTRELRENFCHLACERLRQKLFLRKKRCLCFTRLGGMAYILYKKLNYKILHAQTSNVRVSRTVIVNLNEIVFFKNQATTKRPHRIELLRWQSTWIKLMVYPPSDRARSCSPENKKTPRICRDSGKNMSLSISVLFGRRMVYK